MIITSLPKPTMPEPESEPNDAARLASKKPRGKLTNQLIGLILLFYFGVACTLTLLQIAGEYNIEKNRISNQIDALSNTFQPTIAQALWNFETHTLRSTLIGLYKSELVFGAQVLDKHGDHWELGYHQSSDGEITTTHQEHSDSLMKWIDLESRFNTLYFS